MIWSIKSELSKNESFENDTLLYQLVYLKTRPDMYRVKEYLKRLDQLRFKHSQRDAKAKKFKDLLYSSLIKLDKKSSSSGI